MLTGWGGEGSEKVHPSKEKVRETAGSATWGRWGPGEGRGVGGEFQGLGRKSTVKHGAASKRSTHADLLPLRSNPKRSELQRSHFTDGETEGTKEFGHTAGVEPGFVWTPVV